MVTYPFSVSVMVVLYIIPDTPLSQVYNKLYMFKTAIRSVKKKICKLVMVADAQTGSSHFFL